MWCITQGGEMDVWCITQGGEMECGVSLRVVRWSVVYHSGW